MKRPHIAVKSYSGLLLAGAVLLQANLLPAQNIPIAIMDFDGFGISQTEAIALTNRLRNELFRLGTFDVVDRGMMENILNEQNFQMVGCTSNECLVEVGQLLGARQMVGGSISKVGAMFTVSARVVDVETGKVLGVSDFDIRGGLEEMLTVGMKQVAVMLSAYGVVIKEEAPAVAVAAEESSAEVGVPVGEVVETAPAEESEVMVDIPMEEAAETAPIEEPEVQLDLAMEEAAPSQQPAATMEEKATEQALPGLPVSIVPQKPRRWQSRFMIWPGENYEYLTWTCSYEIPFEKDGNMPKIQPVITGGLLGRYRHAGGGRMEELFVGMMEFHKKFTSKDGKTGSSIFGGLGFGTEYFDDIYPIIIVGAQGQTRHSITILPDIVGDIRLVYTSKLGPSIVASAGVKGSFLHLAGIAAGIGGSIIGFLYLENL